MKAMFPAFALASLAALLTISSGVVAQPSCSLGGQDHVENPLGFLNHGVADTEIAVGTDRNLTCSNVFLRLLDKNGSVVQFSNPTRDAETPLGDYNDSNYPDFMFPVAGNPQTGDVVIIGDPMVYFDYENERFWVVAVEVHIGSGNARVHSSVHIAVSTSATPTDWTTSWQKSHHCLWRDDQQCSNLTAVGHNQTIYVDGDTLYIAFLDDEGTTKRTTLMMLDKDDLMNGSQTTPVFVKLGASPYNEATWGHAIAVEYDAWNNSDPVYTVATGVSPYLNGTPQHQDTILIGAIVPSGSTFTYQSIALTTDGFPDWFDNSGFALGHSGSHISLIGRSFLHATYRPDTEVGGRIWTCHHIQASTGGTNPEPVYGNFVRYYEIHTNGWPNTTATPKVMYYGDILLEDGETYDPSIAVSAEGHIALTWTQSSEYMWPEFWMGVQRSFDTPGTLGYSRKIEDSSAVRTPQKADYSGTEPDPENPCLFWGHSPLGQSTTKWESFVGVLCIPDCDADSYADQDANQVYDAFDVLIFSERFRAGDPRADCNGDRVLDILDYLCFNSLLSSGGRR